MKTRLRSVLQAFATCLSLLAAAPPAPAQVPASGTVVAWGDNSSGQTTIPVGLSGLIAIAAGGWHTIALKNDGTVLAWGANFGGQTDIPAGLSGVTAVAAGDAYNVALKNDGTVMAWGYNSHGQTTVPAGLSGVSAISAANIYAMALKSDGTVVAWGDNSYGQTTIPAGLSGVSAISAGGYHSVALVNPGAITAPALARNTGNLPANAATLTIAGRNFDASTPGNNTVVFNNSAVGTVTAATATQLTVTFSTRPANAGPLTAIVTNGEGNSGTATQVANVIPPPTVTPNTANISTNATTLTITGTDFDAITPGNNTVVFTPGGSGIVTAATATSLTVTGLSGLSLGALHAVVTTNGQPSGAPVQVATVRPPPPTVTLNTANLRANATTLTISGTDFDAVTPGNNTVTFLPSGSGIVTASTATSLTVTSLSGLTPGPLHVVVTTNGQSSGESPIASYPFSGSAVDATGGGNNGVVIGSTSLTTDRFDNFASAYQFDGVSSVINVTQDVFNLGSDYTISAWFMTSDTTKSHQTIFNTIPHAGIALSYNHGAAPGYIAAFIGNGYSWSLVQAHGPKNDYQANQWYHLVFAKSGPNYKTYIDGQLDLETTVPAASAYNQNAGYRFGAIWEGAEVFKGSLDDFQIYNTNNPGVQVASVVAAAPSVKVVAWGKNDYGQTTIPSGLSGVTAIAAEEFHTVALKNDGTVVAWGRNDWGQTSIPVGLNSVTAIAAGYLHTVALKNDGTVVAWGWNDYGQTTIPVGLSGVTAIAAGYFHTVALKDDGTVVVWGWNNYGQTTIPAGLSGVSAIAAGCYHTVTLNNNGTVVAWGDNGYGQTTIPAGLSGVTAIAAGYLHTVALKNDRTAVAWGSNDSGQTTIPAGLSGVIAITGGRLHTAALTNAGSVVAWGDNTSGQTTIPAGLSGATAIAAGGYHTVRWSTQGPSRPPP